MDFADLRKAARRALDPLVWSYIMATADPDEGADYDVAAWRRIEIVPRILQGVEDIDTTLTLPACPPLATPLVIAPTAGHGLASADAELATGRAAAGTGALMVYSHSATLGVGEFGALVTGPWWAQVYLLADRGRTRDYLDRAAAAGAGAFVLTVDGAPRSGDATFRTTVQAQLAAVAGNFPGCTWAEMVAMYASGLSLDDVAAVAAHTQLPIYVKGVLNPADALRAIDAGVSGIVVSNHGRRQLGRVISTANALPDVVEALAGRVPVIVDGGIRSGLDVLRALALGASAVGVGRPVLWGLAADGQKGVTAVLTTLMGELRQAMAGAGVGSIDQIGRALVRPTPS